MNNPLLSLVVIALLASCASPGEISPPAAGTTIAQGKLLHDTMDLLNTQQQFYRDGCSHAFVESVRPVKKGAHLITGQNGEPVGGNLQEIWVVNRCGKHITSIVTYKPDPQGGTTVGIKVVSQ